VILILELEYFGYRADVKFHQGLAPTGPAPEIGMERNARKLALEVLRVFLPINGIMQHAIDVMEDGVLGDRPPWGPFLRWLSTPEEKCIDFPEQKYISEAGKKGR
jgi:hypothetical protein